MKLFMGVLLVLCAAVSVYAENTVVEQQGRQRAEFFSQPRSSQGPVTVNTDYEYGWVDQGGRSGAWKLVAVTAGYTGLKDVSPYVLTEAWDRFGEKDYTVNAGSYFRLTERSYVHAEVGFGIDLDYIYQTLARIEYENKLAGSWNWFAGLRYLNYPANDVYILYPGLVYYFSDGYLQVFFNDGFTESRGSAQSVNLRAKVALTDRLGCYAAAAYGERLYDIFLLPAADQEGYIVAGGWEYRLNKQVRGRIGFSYAHEEPRFIKRSLEAGLTVQF